METPGACTELLVVMHTAEKQAAVGSVRVTPGACTEVFVVMDTAEKQAAVGSVRVTPGCHTPAALSVVTVPRDTCCKLDGTLLPHRTPPVIGYKRNIPRGRMPGSDVFE